MAPNRCVPPYPHPLMKASLTDVSSSAHILPHTHSAGDPHYTGDVYEPSRIGRSGELIHPELLPYKTPLP